MWNLTDNRLSPYPHPVGQTADDIDCQLVGTCPSRPLPRFLITLIMLFVPTALLVGIILFIVYRRMSLESQLVDHWWKISQSDIEFLITRRKALGETGDGLLVSSQAVRVTSSDGANLSKSEPLAVTNLTSAPSSVTSNSGLPRTTVTKVTMTGVGKSSSAADLCYGVIGLGIYRLNKVAIKPMAKLHQSRKLMIELRTVSVACTRVSSRVGLNLIQLASLNSHLPDQRLGTCKSMSLYRFDHRRAESSLSIRVLLERLAERVLQQRDYVHRLDFQILDHERHPCRPLIYPLEQHRIPWAT